MKRHALIWLLVLAGCGGDDADDEVGTDASDEDDTNTASTDESDAGESGTSNGGESGGSASTTNGATSTDETDTTESGETGGCPDNPDASPCEACVLAECCEQLVACDNSESCSCMFDCVEQGTEQVACVQECGLNGPDLTYGQFVSCVQGKCAEQCP